METRSRMILVWISGVIIVGLSLLVAYVCFSILGSSAEGTLRNYKVGGGLAGFLITASFLSSTLMSIYRVLTADQISEYRKQIQELQTKLIKGAPCPPDYSIDVDEKHRLVFARPKNWEPRGGILYAYVETPRPDDDFPANFVVTFFGEKEIAAAYGKDLADASGKLDESLTGIDKLYETRMRASEQLTNVELSREYITVDGIRSAKWGVTWTPPGGTNGVVRQIGVVTYVPSMKCLFEFAFSDDKAGFFVSSAVFNNVISSIRFL
jgi:hypothetical protein